jgi:hypothetical protein
MIYRITGKEMMRTNYQETYELQERLLHYEEDVIDDLRYWLLETGDGVIEAIKAIYFDDMKYPEPDQEINDEKLFEYWRYYYQYCLETLEKHNSNIR